MMCLLPLLICLFSASSVFAQTNSPLPNVGIEISPSSVIAQPISTLSLRATAYSSIPNCDIISYTWSTLTTPTIDSQPIFTTPNDRITSITGLITIGTYNFKLVVIDCNATISLTFNSIVANSSLESDFFVLPPTLVTTRGFVFPPTLPPTLPPTTSAPTIATPPPVDPSLPGPTDPNTGLPVGGGDAGQQPTNPPPPITNAGKGGLNNADNNSTSFNIMYVIIPAAVVAGLVLIGVCVYCRSRSKIPANRTQSSSTSSNTIGTISPPFQAFTGANQLTSPV